MSCVDHATDLSTTVCEYVNLSLARPSGKNRLRQNHGNNEHGFRRILASALVHYALRPNGTVDFLTDNLIRFEYARGVKCHIL